MPYKYIENWLILGLFLLTPLIIGYWAGKNEIIRRPDAVTVDIVKYEDEILVYEHYEGNLVLECNKNKKANQRIYKQFEEVWKKIKTDY